MTTEKIEPKFKIKERLLHVLKRAEFIVLEELYHFKPIDFSNADSKALSIIRNDNYWTGFIEANDDSTENYKVFCFKFKSSANNSGFWDGLLLKLKK
jgi:hypothetical protein